MYTLISECIHVPHITSSEMNTPEHILPITSGEMNTSYFSAHIVPLSKQIWPILRSVPLNLDCVPHSKTPNLDTDHTPQELYYTHQGLGHL